MSVQWRTSDFTRGLDRLQADTDTAMRRWVAEGSAMVERQFKLNASGRPGPNVQSGSHRNSFRATPPAPDGAGRWSSTMGPTMVYSRALEKGRPRWKPGTAYPSFGPAVEYFRRVGAQALMAQILRGVMRG